MNFTNDKCWVKTIFDLTGLWKVFTQQQGFSSLDYIWMIFEKLPNASTIGDHVIMSDAFPEMM